MVEDAHRELQDLHNFKCSEAVATKTTTLNTASIGTIPSDFKDYRGRPWHTDDLGVNRHLLSVTHSEEEVRRQYNSDTNRDTGEPKLLLHKAPTTPGDAISSHIWEVYPIPDGLAQTSNGEYTIKIPYWAYLAFPSTSDWFTLNADEYLVAKATAEAFLLNWDEARYAAWLAKAGTIQAGLGPTGILARVISRDKHFRLSNVDTLAFYPDARQPRVGF